MLIYHRPFIFTRRIRILAAIKDAEEKKKEETRRRGKIDNGEVKERKRKKEKEKEVVMDGVG